MRVVVAPDSFKGALDSRSAAEAIAAGVRHARPDAEIDVLPMADGGEGTLEVLVSALDGNRRIVPTTGPLGAPIEAIVGLIRQASVAVVELATAAGYTLIDDHERDPLGTTTYGLGTVLRTVIEAGVEEVILAVGGSATVDGGAGMMQALGLSLLDADGMPLEPGIGGGQLARIKRIAWHSPPETLDVVQFTIACDVLNPCCGPSGAAAVFGPQKGADAEGVRLLESGLAAWADVLEKTSGRSLRDEPGTGAAGAVAMPLLALAGATLTPGVDVVSEAIGLASAIARADLVVTGEGCLDRQSLMGKVVGAVGRMARDADVPCVALVGCTGEGADACLDVIDRFCTLDGPIADTAVRLETVAGEIVGQM